MSRATWNGGPDSCAPGPGRPCLAAWGLVVALLVAGCSATPGASASPPTTSFAVVGDSITAGDLPLVDDDVQGYGSWVPAAEGTPLEFVGGWAVPGSTTAAMLAGVSAVDADVVVVLGGTNDLTVGTPTDQVLDHLDAIVTRSAAATVVLVAVPPKDAQPAEVLALNGALAAEADREGWAFVDPWTDVSDRGRYAVGTTVDGVHPVQDVADAAGRLIRAAILAAATPR